MKDKAFLDTNLLIYLYDTEEIKSEIVEALLDRFDCWISTQVIAEFANVLHRKVKVDWQIIAESLQELEENFTIFTNSPDTVSKATLIAQQYRFSFYDSLIITAALSVPCSLLFTEDLHHSQLIENRLQIINPFK